MSSTGTTPIQFWVNSSEAMRVHTDGNVGINNAAPTAQLEILSSGAGITPLGVRHSNDSQTLFDIEQRASTNEAWLRMWNEASVETIRLRACGDSFIMCQLGIGTAAPDGTLHVFTGSAGTVAASTNADDLIVEGSANSGITILSGNTSNGVIYFGDDGSNAVGQIDYDHNTNIMAFATAGSGKFYISCVGNVGIGTTPEAWHSSYDGVLQIANSSMSDNSGTQFDVGLNFYYNGSYTKITDGLASRYTQSAGQHYWQHAATGTGTFSFSESMRIDASGNVGIGTASPAKLLDITGDQASMRFTETGTGARTWEVGSGVVANGYWSVYDVTVGLGRLTIDTSGNVGIGTSTPVTALTVMGNVKPCAGHLQMTDAYGLQWDGGAAIYAYDSTCYIRFDTAGAEAMRIICNGNVGIGTAAPGYPLQVNATTTNLGIAVIGSISGGTVRALVQNNSGTANSDAVLQVKQAVSGRDPLLQLTVEGAVDWVMGIDNSDSDKLKFVKNTIIDGTNEFLTIDASGNVGIGTAGPQTVLDLGSGSSGRSISWGGGSGDTWYSTIGSTYASADLALLSGLKLSTAADLIQYSYTGSSGQSGIKLDLSTGDIHFFNQAYASRTAGDTFDWATNTKMFICNNGNVGIGTTSPSKPLDIEAAQSEIQLTSTTGTNRASILFGNTGAGVTVVGVENNAGGNLLGGSTAYASVFGATGAVPVQFGTNNVVNMTILSGGNVGIGTTNPGNLLELLDAGTNTILTINTDGAAQVGNLNFKTNDVQKWIISSRGTFDATNDRLAIQNAGATIEVMSFLQSGNVGIGTNVPERTLDVRGNVVIGDRSSDSSLSLTDSGGTIRGIIRTNSTTMELDSDSAIHFYPNNTKAMTLTAGGLLGIGTTAPLSKLHVNSVLTLGVNGSTNGVINTPESMYFNIDSDATQTDREFVWAINRATDVGGTELMRLDEDGNVGIGITDPSSYDVNATTLVLGGATAATGYGITIRSASDGNGNIFFADATTGSGENEGQITYNHVLDSMSLATADVVAVTIDASGNVGIGTTAPAHAIDVVGTAGLSTGTAWTNTSDSRIKTNVQTITGALSKIKQLRSVSFQYTDEYLSVHDEIDGTKTYNSFVAEEYEDVFPDAVSIGGNLEIITDEETDEKEILIEDLKQFTPTDLPIYLVAAVQELSDKVDALLA